MKQVKVFRCHQLLENNVRAMPLNADQDNVTIRYALIGSITSVAPWPLAGTFRNLTIAFDNAPGANVFSITLYTHGVGGDAGVDAPTALSVTCTGSGTTFTDAINAVAVAEGDELFWYVVCADATNNLSISYEFDSLTDYASAHTGAALNFGFSPSVAWGALDTGPSGAQLGSIAGVTGSITKLVVRSGIPPGLGHSNRFYLTKNGVTQDGTGGTVDTRLFLQDGALRTVGTFDLPVVPGDLLNVVCVNVAGASNAGKVAYGLVFTATTAQQFNTCGVRIGVESGTPQFAWGGQSALTEALIQGVVGPSGLTLAGLEVWGADPFVAGYPSVTYRLRQNASDPVNQPTATAVAADHTSFAVDPNPSHQNVYAYQDRITLASDRAFNGEWHWGFRSTVSAIGPPPPPPPPFCPACVVVEPIAAATGGSGCILQETITPGTCQ